MLRGLRPLPFLIPLFGLSALLAVFVIQRSHNGVRFLIVLVPLALLALILQALVRGEPGTSSRRASSR